MKESFSANTALHTGIFQRIQAAPTGVISFAEYMDLALYHPDWGYYENSDSRKIGRAGDFFTSVSVGDCFGMLLGWEIERRWREALGSPGSLTVVEQGAHDGQLAVDLLEGLENRESELAAKVRYVIVEPSPGRARALSERFAGRDSNLAGVEIVPDAGGIREPAGVFLCNELPDAFPVHRVRFENGTWKELGVAAGDGRLIWRTVEIPEGSDLSRELNRVGADFPEGYTTEVCLEINGWMKSIASVFDRGFWWVIDYGFEDVEYFAPHRERGTLQCYRDHRVVEDPFERPGETDITAHVNFSRLFQCGEQAGLAKVSLSDQHAFLIRAAKPWLTGLEAAGTAREPRNRKRLRQFQTLTHPGMMGRVFKVAELSRGL